jgi:hypothetical protein
MKKSSIDREYRNLTVKERAGLMIAARIRGDEPECQKLTSSAKSKSFMIWASEEACICDSWFSSHMLLILYNAEQRIAELSAEVVRARLCADPDLERLFNDDLAEKMLEQQLTSREERKTALLAFTDWMNACDLEISTEFLEANNVDHSIVRSCEKGELRRTRSYELFAKLLIETRSLQ